MVSAVWRSIQGGAGGEVGHGPKVGLGLVRLDHAGAPHAPSLGPAAVAVPRRPLAMRYAPLVTAAVAASLSGCGLFGPGDADAAVVTEVRVESLDLARDWDGPGNRPDVYVDLRTGVGLTDLTPRWRSQVVQDVERLPLAVRPDDGVTLRLDEELRINVADEDLVGDDEMFTTGPFTFADRYDGQPPGDTDRLAFETDQGRVVVQVRWE